MDRLNPAREHVLGLYRIVLGFLFACHGAKTIFGVLGAKGTAEFGSWPGWWAALIQLVGGVLVMAGLGTRVAALVSSGSMAYAYFTAHQPEGLLPIQNGGEPAALFCWAFLLLAFTGAGRFALENLTRARTAPAGAGSPEAARETAGQHAG